MLVAGWCVGKDYLDVHDLFKLYSKCLEYGLALALSRAEMDMLRTLTTYYNADYPFEILLNVDESRAEDAVMVATKIVKHVSTILQKTADVGVEDFYRSQQF